MITIFKKKKLNNHRCFVWIIKRTYIKSWTSVVEKASWAIGGVWGAFWFQVALLVMEMVVIDIKDEVVLILQMIMFWGVSCMRRMTMVYHPCHSMSAPRSRIKPYTWTLKTWNTAFTRFVTWDTRCDKWHQIWYIMVQEKLQDYEVF